MFRKEAEPMDPQRREKIMKLSPTMMAAAVSGILIGAAGCAANSPPPAESAPGMPGAAPAGSPNAKHACKGQNMCKGQGGCKTDKNACQGKNDCKGQGGCKGWWY